MDQNQDSRTRASLIARLRRTNASDVWNSAWEQFYCTYSPMILTWCRKWGLQAADCEDIVASVLVILGRRMDTFEYDPSYRFRGWLKTVVANEIRAFLARQSSRKADQGLGSVEHSPLEDLADVDSAAGELADTLHDNRALMNRAMESVRTRVQSETWLAFERTSVLGHDPQQVAKDLGLSIAVVYKSKSRVLEHLRSAVDQLRKQQSHVGF